MCETANQQSISSHMVVYLACKMRFRWLTFRRCFVNRAISRNRSLRDAKPARHLFVWFAKHCLAEHCLSFRGDADECEKQLCFVFRICLAFFWLSFVAALSTQHFHIHDEVCSLKKWHIPSIINKARGSSISPQDSLYWQGDNGNVTFVYVF